MGRHVPTPEAQACITALEAEGYKVVRGSTYAGQQRRIELLANEVEWERQRAADAHHYARRAWDEERRLADRLNQVCAAAASLGVSITQINDALAPRAVTDAMVEAALIEHRTSDLDGRALVRAMLAAALGA